MSRIEFETPLLADGPNGAWPRIDIPFDVEQAFGSRARVSVKGTMNGFAFRTSLFPNGDGTHHMMVNRQMRDGAKAAVGDLLKMTLEPDTGPREVETPEDLRTALAGAPQSAAHWEKLSYSHKKEYVEWIEGAKRPETRANRIAKTLEMLVEGKRLKG